MSVSSHSGAPIRVLVTDDSVVARRLVTQALSGDSDIKVVATAPDGRIALRKALLLNPDIITMDIEMPEMDGITAVRELRAAGYTRPIIMCSTLTERGATATLDALSVGASDYVTKPNNGGSFEESLRIMTEDLVPKVHALVRPRVGLPPISAALGRSRVGGSLSTAGPSVSMWTATPELVLIGSSTGGPSALATLIAGFTGPPPVPVVIVQHMPPVFTRHLAARLDKVGPARVVEAEHGMMLSPGTVYIAPGGRHLEVSTSAGIGRVKLNDSPPVNYCRPAVDVMFHSASKAYGGGLLAIVLTGMGADGAQGAAEIAAAGGRVWAQDEATSVVWGMPGAVVSTGCAQEIMPINDICRNLERTLSEAKK